MRQPFAQAYPELVVEPGWNPAHQVAALDPSELTPQAGRWPWEQRVEVDGDGEVLGGYIAVAWALVEATEAHNPVLILGLLQRWIDEGAHADEAERDWRRGWEQQLADNTLISWELERSPEALLERAGMEVAEREVYRRALAGESARQIALTTGVSRSTVRRWIDEGTLLLQGLRVDARQAASA